MTSNSYDTRYEDALKQYDLAKVFYNSADYQKASLYLDKALSYRPPYPAVYYLRSECSVHLKDYKNALKIISEGLEQIESLNDKSAADTIYQVKFLHQRYKIYTALETNEKAQADLERIKTLLVESYKSGGISQQQFQDLGKEIDIKINDTINSVLNPKAPMQLNERHKESKKVWDLIQEAKSKSLLAKEHNIVHLISMRWFDKWKKFTDFAIFSHEKLELDSEEIEESVHEQPGPIDPDEILDRSDILIDPDKIRDYCNYVVKLGLEENKDFIIVSHSIWKFLFSIYSGRDVKRFVISINDDTNQTAVEVWLKKVNVLLCPVINKSQDYGECQIRTLYLSKKETVKDLKEKITRIYSNMHEICDKVNLAASKIWKLDPRSDYKEIINKVIQSPEGIVIKANKLEEGTVLEDAEIGDTDTVICEFKFEDKWTFKSEQEHSQDMENRCGYCSTPSKTLSYCQCMTIKYCNHECQKSHRVAHRDKCNLVKNEQTKANEVFKQFKITKTSKFISTSRYGITGLQNLGNTCFMNSSLQCLSNVYELTSYFLGNDFIKDLNRENRLGTGGRLAASYSELIKEMWHGSDTYVSPWEIKKIIGEVASQFCGYNQQDSQEFLSYMLDGLHEDLNKIKKKPFVESLESNNRPDEIVAAESWANHLKRNQSTIVDYMHGQYKSKLVCPDCGRVSITFDPFMSVSLPIPNVNFTNFSLYFIYKDSRKVSTKLTMNMIPNATTAEVIKQISKFVEVPEESIELNLLKEHRVIDYKTKNYTVKDLKNHEGMLFAFEVFHEITDGPIESWQRRAYIRFEIIMKQELKRGGDDEISFSRVVYIPQDSNAKTLHLNLYMLMRYFIKNYMTAEPENPFKDLNINMEAGDLATLEAEYSKMLTLDPDTGAIYSIYFFREHGLKKVKTFIPYKENWNLADYFSSNDEERQPVSVELVFNKAVKSELLKLNKCQESTTAAAQMKEPKNFSIYECIDMFTRPEQLDKDNLWYCNVCKDHKQATKTMELYKTPKILILHLKRFRTNRVSSIGSFFFTSSSSKITSLVDFPIKGLDIRRYVLGKTDEPPIYDLFAISNHYGGLGGGHYTAFAKNHFKDQWFDFNDSSVSKQDPEELVSEAAYVLFYRRRDSVVNSGASGSPNGEDALSPNKSSNKSYSQN